MQFGYTPDNSSKGRLISPWLVCEVFMDSTENVNQEELSAEVQQKIRDHQDLLAQTDNELKRTMENHRREIRKWSIQLKQEMAIRVLLNK